MNCSTPGFPVHTNSWSLLKLISIELVMPSNQLNLSSPSPPAFSLSQQQGLFKWVSSPRQYWPKVLELQHQSFQWIFRIDLSREYKFHTNVDVTRVYAPSFLSRHNKDLEWRTLKPPRRVTGSWVLDRPCYSSQVSNGLCYSSWTNQCYSSI